ncbi:MAG: sensor histidine kinase [Telluria sp.]
MWRRIADWYGKWEDEQIAVLDQPELAAQAPGYRRLAYRRLAQRSPVERQQLRGMMLALKGWRGWLATALMLAAFSLCGVWSHALAPDMGLAKALVTANMLGIALAFILFGAWFNYRRLAHRKFRTLLTLLLYVSLAAIGMSGGALWISDQAPAIVMQKLPRMFAYIFGTGLAVALPVFAIGAFRNRQHEALTAQLQHDAERDRMARELAESQLRLLRAQIEPHFLFNTLGAVQQLAQHGAPRAAELTAHLIAFLRASLSEMRSEQVRLDTEFGLVESYLRVMQFRLGQRLRFSLALAPALAHVQVPSMILLTLVENAIKHGIEPALRGGEVAVSAVVEDGAVRLRVRDSGAGMGAAPGNGTGLDNLRRRLQLAYGPAASLALHDADPGLVADLTLPLSPP